MPVTIAGCLLPTATELQQLQMELFPRYLEGRLAFDLMPFASTDAPMITLQQPDIYKGLQGYRGLDKPTFSVKDRYNPWGTLCEVQPGYWGEHDEINETHLTKWAGIGQCASIMDATELLTRLQQRLLERRANRIEYNIWQTLVFGRYSALDEDGMVIHEGVFNLQNVSAAIPWTNFAGSFPLRDLRTVQLLGRGTSARFDSCARAYMNRETANLLFSNTNPSDVGRVGLSACCNFMGLEQVNQQFLAQGLPQIVIYDEGYYDDNGNFNIYIPYGYVVIIGCRPNNVPVGHYWLTRNAIGCSISSGFWQKMIDTCATEITRRIIVADGHNGGPALEYPRMVAVLRVA